MSGHLPVSFTNDEIEAERPSRFCPQPHIYHAVELLELTVQQKKQRGVITKQGDKSSVEVGELREGA